MRVHFLEYTKTNTQVLDVVSHALGLRIKPYLEMPASMLLRRLLVSGRNYEIVYRYDISLFIISVVRRPQILVTFKVILVDLCERTEEGKAIGSAIKIGIPRLSEFLADLPFRLLRVAQP